ncbi:MAG: hypothetical protein E5W88_28015, partial [Mesorhizobium sp.]
MDGFSVVRRFCKTAALSILTLSVDPGLIRPVLTQKPVHTHKDDAMNPNGQIAIVTGGGSGLGEATARA